jgi:hypothetical protein
MRVRRWLYTQPIYIRHIVLFCVVFIFVLCVFLLWYQFRKGPEIHNEAIVAAARPRLRVGIAHPFLEGMVREIGSSFITTVRVVPPEGRDDAAHDVCDEMDIFFGISNGDEWVKDMCGENHEVAFVFLDTYVQAQEKRIAGEAITAPQSVYTTGYFWLSTQGAKNMIRTVAQVLSSADGVHKVSYLDNAYVIGHQLDDAYKKVKDQLYDMRQVWLMSWGDEWGALADEYNGRIQQIVDVTYDPSVQLELMESIYTNIQKHARVILLVDATFPLSSFITQHPSVARHVVVLDPWGDFSDTWSFAAFVEQNLLRMAQVL